MSAFIISVLVCISLLIFTTYIGFFTINMAYNHYKRDDSSEFGKAVAIIVMHWYFIYMIYGAYHVGMKLSVLCLTHV